MSKESRILVIEDSPVQRAVISNVVKELGYEPIVIEHIDTSIYQHIERGDIKVVLLDLMLLNEDGAPVVDGFQLCHEIKNRDDEVKVIIVSSENDDAAREFAALQGADGFISKPFKVSDLEQYLEKNC